MPGVACRKRSGQCSTVRKEGHCLFVCLLTEPFALSSRQRTESPTRSLSHSKSTLSSASHSPREPLERLALDTARLPAADIVALRLARDDRPKALPDEPLGNEGEGGTRERVGGRVRREGRLRDEAVFRSDAALLKTPSEGEAGQRASSLAGGGRRTSFTPDESAGDSSSIVNSGVWPYCHAQA